MSNAIVFIVIVLWIIGSVMKALRTLKGPPTIPMPPIDTTRTAPLRATRTAAQNAYARQQGDVGRAVSTRNPDQSRAMASASPRLAEGAEYGPIVADRLADQAARERFAQEANELIRSEPARRRAVTQPISSPDPTDAGSELQRELRRIGNNRAFLLDAIVLAEIMGKPRCMELQRRQKRS